MSERLDTPRSVLQGLHVPKLPDPGDDVEYPPSLAIGSDGSFFISAQADELKFSEIPRSRRIFVGVAQEGDGTFAEGLLHFARRTEPRVLGLDGRVYVQCRTREDIAAAQKRGARMFYGYAATANEAWKIHWDIESTADDVLGTLKTRPRPKRRLHHRRVAKQRRQLH